MRIFFSFRFIFSYVYVCEYVCLSVVPMEARDDGALSGCGAPDVDAGSVQTQVL